MSYINRFHHPWTDFQIRQVPFWEHERAYNELLTVVNFGTHCHWSTPESILESARRLVEHAMAHGVRFIQPLPASYMSSMIIHEPVVREHLRIMAPSQSIEYSINQLTLTSSNSASAPRNTEFEAIE